MAYDFDIPLIGCNLSNGKYKDMNDEDNKREAYMLKTISEFIPKGRCLVQLGDHHLRSIPISKEYLIYSGSNKDDRGKYGLDDLIVNHPSPIFEKYKNSNNVLIMRVKKEYEKEQNFIKSRN